MPDEAPRPVRAYTKVRYRTMNERTTRPDLTRTPTPEAVEAARLEAVAKLEAEAKAPEARAKLAALMDDAKRKADAAREAVKAYRAARPDADDLDDEADDEAAEALDAEARALYAAARQARAEALDAEEKADALAAVVAAKAAYFDKLRTGGEALAVVVLTTPADEAAKAAPRKPDFVKFV